MSYLWSKEDSIKKEYVEIVNKQLVEEDKPKARNPGVDFIIMLSVIGGLWILGGGLIYIGIKMLTK